MGKPRVEVVSVAVRGEITQGGWLSTIGSADGRFVLWSVLRWDEGGRVG